ncbi:MAG: response regulator [Pseudomonadota bacterium]
MEKELLFMDLIPKAREIFLEMGERAALSYIKSSHRLLSKVYHPDLNPKNMTKAHRLQQSLNRISLLIEGIEDEDILEIIKKGIPEQAESEKKKVLVVEDEFGLQEVFRDIFLMEGYEARVAVDGVEGYDVYKKFRPDLVFTDVVMPNISGIELVKKIRGLNPRIKVIYISGFFGIKKLKSQLDEDILRYGYRTLAKPFKASAMLDLVGDYLAEA